MGASEAEYTAEKRAVGIYFQEVQILFDPVALGLVTTGDTKAVGHINPRSSFNVKETLALKPDCSEVVEDVDPRARIVIEVVSDCGGKLRDRTTRGSRRIVCSAVEFKSSGDYAHVDHWPNSEFFIAPAIGVHRAKGAESQIPRSVQIGREGFTAKSEAAAESCVSIPASLRVTRLKLVFSSSGSMGKAQLEADLVAKVEITVEGYDRTGSSTGREARLARRNRNNTTYFDLVS